MIHRKIPKAIVRGCWNIVFYHIFHLHVEGRENIPPSGPAILTPNHKSDWDPPLVGAASNKRWCRYMAKSELFKSRIFGYIIRQLGAFPIHRGRVDQKSFRESVRILRTGQLLTIFPEGHRIPGSGLGRFHEGPATLALMTGTPLIPVCIVGSEHMPHPDKSLAVLFGRQIPVTKQKPTKEKIDDLTEQVRTSIMALHDDYMKRLEK